MRLANALGTRFSMRSLAAVGFVLMSAGLVWGATTGVSDGFARTAIWSTVVGLGFGMSLFAAQNTALLTLPRARAASGSALVQTLRQVGSVLCIAVLGALLNREYRAAVDTQGLPAHAAGAVRESAQAGLEVAHQTGSGALAHSVTSAFVQGMDAALWTSAAVALVGALVAWRLMPALRPAEPEAEVPLDGAESGRAEEVVDRADASPSRPA
jgi:hypothetical protein